MEEPLLKDKKPGLLFHQIKFMINLTKPPFEPAVHKEFVKEIINIDSLRGESFSEIFPELAKAFSFEKPAI